MIEREDARGGNSGLASLDPSDPFSPKSGGGDASPVSSLRYSSCGESECDPYCSANSVMGTPSMGSSTGPFNDCVDTEFGSLRSSFELADDAAFENFSLGPSLRLPNMSKASSGAQRSEIKEDNISTSHSNRGVGRLSERSNGTIWGNSDQNSSKGENPENFMVGSGWGNGPSLRAGLEGDSTVYAEPDESDLKDLSSVSEMHFDGREMEREEDENSSIYDHSEGEDSMYGADGDNGNVSYLPRNVQSQEMARSGNENPLFIGSSVAFGSDDWYDFELESAGDITTPLALDKYQELKAKNIESEKSLLTSVSLSSPALQNVNEADEGKDWIQARDALATEGEGNCTEISTAFVLSGQSRTTGEVKLETSGNHVASDPNDTRSINSSDYQDAEECARDISVPGYQAKGVPHKTRFFENSCADDMEELEQKQSGDKDPSEGMNFSIHSEIQSANTKESIATFDSSMLKDQEPGTSELHSEPQSSGVSDKYYTDLYECETTLSSGSRVYLPNQSSAKSSPNHSIPESNAEPLKTENMELNDSYDLVHDMAEVLLDSVDSRGPRLTEGDKMFRLHLPLRDGGRTATTSSSDNSAPSTSQQLRIEGVKVIGAKQKKGDVSLGERLVGVKEYTVYVIRVWSDQGQWQVERRYRDFFTLYRRLKSLSADQGWVLPHPWSDVEKESRKIFGNASPKIVAERSVLIQECLQSVLAMGLSSRPPIALLRFLSPHDKFLSSPPSDPLASHPRSFDRGSSTEKLSSLGKTISLVVEMRPQNSTRQLLEAQQYTCAGCHKYFDDGMTLVRDLAHAFGWGKPRLCEYTGQLFCSSCHRNETAVLPARVLHHWDFNRYPVSQLAKSYLDSIHEQPMLCVSAVNPFLFSKVPALYHVMCARKKIGTMLDYVRCPFRMKMSNALGWRRYLLESNDFFALKDLIDLSKGAFAALPVIVETISRKILEHITDHCLVCCDVGVPCNARQACNDPSSLIFPFQVGEVEKCPFCELVFHKQCFKKITSCLCGARLVEDEPVAFADSVNGDSSRALELPGRESTFTPALGFITGLFSRSKTDREERSDGNTVILMGSLPSNDL